MTFHGIKWKMVPYQNHHHWAPSDERWLAILSLPLLHGWGKRPDSDLHALTMRPSLAPPQTSLWKSCLDAGHQPVHQTCAGSISLRPPLPSDGFPRNVDYVGVETKLVTLKKGRDRGGPPGCTEDPRGYGSTWGFKGFCQKSPRVTRTKSHCCTRGDWISYIQTLNTGWDHRPANIESKGARSTDKVQRWEQRRSLLKNLKPKLLRNLEPLVQRHDASRQSHAWTLGMAYNRYCRHCLPVDRVYIKHKWTSCLDLHPLSRDTSLCVHQQSNVL